MSSWSLGRSARLWAVGVVVLGVMLVAAAGSGVAAPYYQGKTIEIIVPFGEGGGSDVWTRFLAPYLEKHIEGNPRVLVRNMPGGESIIGANWYVNNAKPDGLMLMNSSASTVFPWLLGRAQVQYDFTKLRPIVITPAGGAVYSSPGSGVHSPADLLNPSRPLVYGGISAAGLDMVTLLSFELLELDVRTVLGFEGRGPARLAFERGETNIDYQTTSAYMSQVVPLVEEGNATPLMTFGSLAASGEVVRDPAVPDLPTVPEVYRELYGQEPSGPAWGAYRATMTAAFAFQKILWAHPDTPDEIMDALYDAVERMIADPDFQEKGDALLGGYPTMSGREAGAALQDAFSLPDDVRAYLIDLLSTKYDVRF